MSLAPILMKTDIADLIKDDLDIKTVFDLGSIKIGSKSIPVTIDESTVISWIIIVFALILALILTRGLKAEGKISRRQAFLELCYEKSVDFFKGLMGEQGEGYIPWLMSMALFIGFSNIIGIFSPTIFGFIKTTTGTGSSVITALAELKPPTKSVQVTSAMALTSIVLIEGATYKAKGFGGRLKAFAQPVWILTPINLLEVFTKPLSLAMRLFGNVLASFTIMELIKIATRNIVLPMILSLYFDLFDGLLQAYIFVFLTALYIQEGTGGESRRKKAKKLKKKRVKA